MSELSTLAKVKNVLRGMPIGAKFTTQDISDRLPSEDRKTVFTAVSALRLMDCLESCPEKTYATVQDNSGQMIGKMLTIYKLKNYPMSDDHEKPIPYTRMKKEEPVVQQKLIPQSKKQFKRVFAGTWTQRLPEESLKAYGEEVFYLSERFISDFALTSEAPTYELAVAYALKNFDPKTDAVFFFGDTLVVAMAIFYLATKHKEVNIGRWSTHDQSYKIRKVKIDNFKL